MKAKCLGVLLPAVLLTAVTSGAEAQGVRLMPWVGMYAPTSDLGSVQGVRFGQRESTLAYGANLEFGQPDRVLGFRLAGSFATDSDVPIEDVGCPTCEGRSTVLTATGALILRPIPGMPVFRPYALVGAGAKWYDFEIDEGPNVLISDQTRFTAVGGIGFQLFPNSPVSLFAELADYISGFDLEGNEVETNDIQHDLFLKMGISIGFGARR